MLELQVASRDITNGNIAVSWCVQPEALQLLAAEKVKDPQVVIVVAPTNNYHPRREYRKVVPLHDLMTYLEFRSSGENQIRAFISQRTKKDARATYLTKDEGEYITYLLSEDGKEWSYHFRGELQNITDENGEIITVQVHAPELGAPVVLVNVPTGVFAKEPASWEKSWVNYWFRSKPQDQCDFRRRRLLAYTVQPLIMLLDVMVMRTLMLLIASLWWSRGLTLKFHLHPMQYHLGDTVELFTGGSWVVPTLPEDAVGSDLTTSYLFRKLWKVVFTPPVLGLVALFTVYHIWLFVLLILGCTIVLAGLFWLTATGTIVRLFDYFTKWFAKAKTDQYWYLKQEEMDNLTCTPGFKTKVSVASLPAKHRSISLHLQDLKARVCRPFSE